MLQCTFGARTVYNILGCAKFDIGYKPHIPPGPRDFMIGAIGTYGWPEPNPSSFGFDLIDCRHYSRRLPMGYRTSFRDVDEADVDKATDPLAILLQQIFFYCCIANGPPRVNKSFARHTCL